jgi:hypothetical protein
MSNSTLSFIGKLCRAPRRDLTLSAVRILLGHTAMPSLLRSTSSTVMTR